jgi:glutamyl-tRNA reductase
MARLCVVGLSHKTAPVDVRERVGVPKDGAERWLKQVVATPGIGEAMVVSTCNRVELYAGIDGEDATESLRELLIEGRRLPKGLRQHLYCHEGEAALRHLFRVAASLDSMVVGESQILGQVKEAYALALDAGTVGSVLTRTLPRAFQLAKRVRSETEVARSASSVASVAVELAAQIFGSLDGRSVLLLGAGKMGDLSARHLKAAGIRTLKVVNRTEARALELAARLGGEAAVWSALDRLLGEVDIVLCSTGAAQPVIVREQVQRAMRARRGRWLFFIDIAVPRDVEPEVGGIENVYLYDVDALEQVVAHNRAGRAEEAHKAEEMVDDEVRRFHAVVRTEGVVPTIKALRGHFLDVARGEAERALGRLSQLGERERGLVAQLAETIANKLLHAPTTALKREATAEPPATRLIDAVHTLFPLDAAAEGRDADAAPPASPAAVASPTVAIVRGGEGKGE